MENTADFNIATIDFDDDVLFHEFVMEYAMREKEEKLRGEEYGACLPDVMTEDSFRLLMEMAGDE